jgi:hypothetical protein
MTGHGWEPNTNGGPLFLAAGQDFIDTMIVDQPWPAGTTSWIVIAGVSGHFADGVLSTDRTTFTYLVEAPGGDDDQVSDRAVYQYWLKVPNATTGTDDDLKWEQGEVRRKD